MAKRLLDFAFKEKGSCVIVAGGKSVDFLPEEYYRGKFIIGVNQSWRKVKPDILVRKEMPEKQTALEEEQFKIFASLHSMGDGGHPQNPKGENITLFKHNNNNGDRSPIDIAGCHPSGDKVIVSGSTITSAIHIAAIMGFTTINLVGHDLCMVDGETNFKGYYDGVLAFYENTGYARWLDRIAYQTRFVSDYVFDLYGAVVVTVSPFMGLRGEGHEIA